MYKGSLMQLFINQYGIGNRKGFLKPGKSKYCEAGAFTDSRRYKSHDPLPNSLAESRRGIAMLRSPASRLESAFQHNFHTYHMPRMQREKMILAINESSAVGGDPKRVYATWPGVAGCQTKMMLGADCSRYANLTESNITKAILRLESVRSAPWL